MLALRGVAGIIISLKFDPFQPVHAHMCLIYMYTHLLCKLWHGLIRIDDTAEVMTA